MKKSFSALFSSFALALLYSLPASAAPIDINIVSNSLWKSSAALDADWNTVGFDDSSWASARAPYPNPIPPTGKQAGTTAQYIWHDPSPSGVSNGTNGVNEAYFRYEFDLNLTQSSLPLLAQALINVDDDFEFFVNGALVYGDYDEGNESLTHFVDFTSALRNGNNVFGIHAVDGGWNNIRDRDHEYVLFDATIKTVPEPSALVLMGLGLIGLLKARRTS
jgi:hypothetical protein